MCELWNKWRGRMHLTYIMNKTMNEALKIVPDDVIKDDWEWLVKDNYFTPQYKERSKRASKNRSYLPMLHRMDSKPVREVIYEMGGKDDNSPDMGVLFYETHKKKDKLVEPETIQKYEEICEVVQSNTSLRNVDVVEKCFGPQQRIHVICHGGGVTRKHLKGPSCKKAELEAKLNVRDEENHYLKNRLNTLEDEFQKIKEMLQSQEKS
ncbi:unnamed protein product [Cuscuta europaea]|nr:unnamed protein product [Cuscuta europaea]